MLPNQFNYNFYIRVLYFHKMWHIISYYCLKCVGKSGWRTWHWEIKNGIEIENGGEYDLCGNELIFPTCNRFRYISQTSFFWLCTIIQDSLLLMLNGNKNDKEGGIE